MVDKVSSFADFVRFPPHTYAGTQQSLSLLGAAIISYISALLKILQYEL